MSYNSFHDLQKSEQFKVKSSHDFMITLINHLFGNISDNNVIKIDLSLETEQNHEYLKNQWESIHIFYKTPNNIKNTQKLVRQTFKHIVGYLNKTYNFKQPIKFEHKRSDTYQKGVGGVTKHWIEFSLV